ncbi:cell division protein FtsZ [Paraferrimonas sp. SM1919]|uniref:cell division protein FtsZ n=1 Tax=Paraferrimonas sp. SM1919 TaxID=2662263 RepID=UPI0013D4F5A7|nr:cell division protein FtsZ [Paraferrimonas sp. SM1919]
MPTFDIISQQNKQLNITVLGVGGCGCNTINQLQNTIQNDNVKLVAVNTDSQSLVAAKCETRLQLGPETTRGLGAGANPEVGLAAAAESEDIIRESIEFADVVFLTGGMGGGTGTGAIPYINSLASELNKPVIVVVTTPFSFEGDQRCQQAENGVDKLLDLNNAVIVLPNDKLVETLDKKITMKNAFIESNRILQDVLQGLVTTICQSGMVNVDLNDFITVISHKGRAAMGVARQYESHDIEHTIKKALNNPLLAEVDLSQAQGAIISVLVSDDIELDQYQQICTSVSGQLSPKAVVIIGLTEVENLDCELELMIIATGMQNQTATATEQLYNPSCHSVSETKLAEDDIPKFLDERWKGIVPVDLKDFIARTNQSPQAPTSQQSQKTDYEVPTAVRKKQQQEVLVKKD